MYIYKREKSNLMQAKRLQFFMANTLGSSLCMSGVLEAKQPYSGLYIKNGKVILENVFEEIEVGDKLYKMYELTTSVQTISCDDYITGIDLSKGIFSYVVGNIKYDKIIGFSKYDDILCIEYNIENNYDKPVIFRVLPFITYRELLSMRNATTLRFNQRNIDDGTIINLSVSEEENLFLKSDTLTYIKNPRILNNVKHEMTTELLKKEFFIEDLFVPGEFEINLKPNESQKICLYISTKDVNIKNIDFSEIRKENEFELDKICRNIADEFVELKDLAKGIENLNISNYLVNKLPFKIVNEFDFKIDYETNKSKFIKDIEDLTDVVCAIDGQYLILEKCKEAGIVFAKVRRKIREIDELDITDKECYIKVANLKLWYIEMLNKLYQKQPSIADIYLSFIKEILYDVLDEKKQEFVLSNIVTCALSYNAIKIYENMLSKLGYEDVRFSDIAVCIQNLIENKYWIEEKRTMKKNITDDTANANIDMLYTLSLSYPCVFGSIPIKLLDTIFKELYTPYGLRQYPKNSILNDGLIYPKYMAHFIKANLRQNGVTRASQKIAYNLVKELIQDISKYINGGVKRVYQENGINIDTECYDLLTNAEIIRLYDMLT